MSKAIDSRESAQMMLYGTAIVVVPCDHGLLITADKLTTGRNAEQKIVYRDENKTKILQPDDYTVVFSTNITSLAISDGRKIKVMFDSSDITTSFFKRHSRRDLNKPFLQDLQLEIGAALTDGWTKVNPDDPLMKSIENATPLIHTTALRYIPHPQQPTLVGLHSLLEKTSSGPSPFRIAYVDELDFQNLLLFATPLTFGCNKGHKAISSNDPAVPQEIANNPGLRRLLDNRPVLLDVTVEEASSCAANIIMYTSTIDDGVGTLVDQVLLTPTGIRNLHVSVQCVDLI